MASADRLYFAYSVLLDPETFALRMKEGGHATFRLPEGKVGEAQDVDIVFNFHSSKWGGRIASLVAMPGHSVYGKVLSATALGAATGRATTTGPVSETYANALARGAEAAGLPKAYWEKLKAEAAILAKVQAVGRELHLK